MSIVRATITVSTLATDGSPAAGPSDPSDHGPVRRYGRAPLQDPAVTRYAEPFALQRRALTKHPAPLCALEVRQTPCRLGYELHGNAIVSRVS